MAEIIDGLAVAARLRHEVAIGVADLAETHQVVPGLAVIIVGDDPASTIYVRRKLAQTRAVGMHSFEHRLAGDISQTELLQLIERLNANDAVHGILVQLPLPPHLDAHALLDAIAPEKDVDGFHPVNVGRLSVGSEGLVPCTPLGCMMLLDEIFDDYRGLKAVVIGKSNIVGKPTAMLLLEREATVTVTHIHTRGLADIVRTADIVVVAAGSPALVRGDWVKSGAVVIDVGINRILVEGKERIVGDAVFDELSHARAVSPVPGGVGPMTVACLLANTLKAACQAAARDTACVPAMGQKSGIGSRAVAAALLFAARFDRRSEFSHA